MKKIILLCWLLVLAMLLCACADRGVIAGDGAGGETWAGSAEDEAPAADDVPAADDAPVADDFPAEDTEADAGAEQPPETGSEGLDYRPGNENTMSTARFVQITDRSGIAVQDQMLYYVGSDYQNLYKLPLGAPASEAESIWFDTDGMNLNYDDIQVLGDWVYIQDGKNMYRVMTTPGGFEMLTSNIDVFDRYIRQSVIRGNEIFYTGHHSEQVSAQNYEDYADIYCHNIETGEDYYMASVPSGSPLRIESYTRDAALLVTTGFSPGQFLYHFDVNIITEVPESLKTDYDSIISDGESFYIAVYDDGAPPYRSSSTSIYRISAANNYEMELVTTVEQSFHIRAYADGIFFGEDLGGLCYVQDGVKHNINADAFNAAMCYPGDGYLYYRSYNNLLCRVRLDGSGWEKL